VLVVVPGPSVGFWAGEWAFWGAPGTNVVPYAGSAAARAVIQDHELWLAPSSLDGKATPRLRLRPGLAAKARPTSARMPGRGAGAAVPLKAYAKRASW
jgi:putative hemolysin